MNARDSTTDQRSSSELYTGTEIVPGGGKITGAVLTINKTHAKLKEKTRKLWITAGYTVSGHERIKRKKLGLPFLQQEIDSRPGREFLEI